MMNPSKQSLEDTLRTVTAEGDSVDGNHWVEKAKGRCRLSGISEKEITAIVDRYRYRTKQILQTNT